MEEENDAAAAAAAAPDAVGQEATKQTNNDESSNAAVDGTADAKDTASSGRAKRVRKATTTYVPEEETKKEIIIPDGKGEKLQDMPNVVAKFQDITWSNPGLKHLYNIVFGRGKKADFKKHLLQFNGLVFSEGNEEAEKDKLLEKIFKLKLDQLKEVMDLCDIGRSPESFGGKNPDKEMLCNRFVEWLEEPKASGKKLKGAPKKSSGKRKGSSTADAKAPKKPSAKKTKKESSKPKTKKKTSDVEAADDGEMELNIPGVSTAKIRSKIESIVSNADKESVTVKDVRKELEKWLDMDLVEHKEGIRALVMDAM